MAHTIKLTANQSKVLNVLTQANEPLSAYAILDALKDQGLRAPVQVYRALDKLLGVDLVHRLESLNAYVACNQCDGHEGTVIFAICTECGVTLEISDDMVGHQVYEHAQKVGFKIQSQNIEIRGLCSKCAP